MQPVEVPGQASFEAAFEGLFLRCCRLAHRLIGDAAVAEEVAAEAMTRAYAHWPKIAGLDYRDAWVLRVVTNLAIDRARRHRWSLVQLGRHGEAATVASGEEVTALRITLVAALSKLPRRQRQIVVLRHLSGLSEAEVAKATGLSLGTVKTHLRRGLDSLRKTLGDLTEVGTYVT